MLPLPSLFAAAGLALVHLFAGKLRFLEAIPRSRWLSFAGGMSVAYVFVHLLPELVEAQEAVEHAAGEALAFFDHHVFLLALLGLTVFYGLERAAILSRPGGAEEEGTSTQVFWLHIGSFAVFNALIGYLLAQWETEGLGRLILFSVAMGLHFVVNDYGLRQHHKDDYRRIGRWVLALTVLLGWGLGQTARLSDAVLALPLAFVAGGVILNVLKEELPAERESRFWAFALGVAIYAALLVAL
ncbi:MAG TPA: hypothetical protein VGR27_07305 [Longimicrobiaceae bacterium]|nr:hypothetical protein [Longimicrobiaceae bacterium]